MPTGLQRRVRKQPASRGGSVSKKTHMAPVAVAQAVRSASELKALQSFRMISVPLAFTMPMCAVFPVCSSGHFQQIARSENPRVWRDCVGVLTYS